MKLTGKIESEERNVYFVQILSIKYHYVIPTGAEGPACPKVIAEVFCYGRLLAV